MLKQIFHDSFENFKIYKALYNLQNIICIIYF